MSRTEHDRAIALAGLFLAASLVRDVARHGRCDPEDMATSLESLFQIDASNTEAVYGSIRRLGGALGLLADELARPRDAELTRYCVGLLVLERKLARRPDLLERISAGIETTAAKRRHFDLCHPNIVASLAAVYAETVSTLQPRIMVHGEADHLGRPDNADRVRALLLAGIRAAVLWRQSGGGRLSLLLRRRALLDATRELLAGSERPHGES